MRILTWHDKHGDYMYEADGKEGLGEASLKILQERLDHGYLFWPEDTEDRARKILDAKDGGAAYDLLEERDDHEYERISFNYTK